MNQETESENIFGGFDYYCKKTLSGYSLNLHRDRKRRLERETSLNCLNITGALTCFDQYPSLYTQLMVGNYAVKVINEVLGTALEELTPKKREVVLLYYFFETTDSEIAERLNCTRENICIMRNRALKQIKIFMERGITTVNE